MSNNNPWWPSPYGPDDQLGMLNEITPAKVAAAARLARQGRVYDLAHIMDEKIPAFPGRTFRQILVTGAHLLNRRRPNAGPAGWGENNVNWIIECVASTWQLGTHLDGLNHLQIGDRFYNGHTLTELAEEWGTNRLGIETVPQIITRGLLLDIAGLPAWKQKQIVRYRWCEVWHDPARDGNFVTGWVYGKYIQPY